MVNERGWMPGIEHVPSAAYGYPDVAPGGMQPLAVMSHIMQGYQRTMIAWAQERPFATPKSAHFTIGRDGRIVQHVGIFEPAWAAGHVQNPSWPLYRPGTNPNRYLVHIEHEGFSTPPGYGYDYVYNGERPWPEAMVQASIGVQRWILELLGLAPSEQSVIGHNETDAVNRAEDPGRAWPRARILEALRSRTPSGDAAAGPKPGDAYTFDTRALAWPDGDAAKLVQSVLQGRVHGYQWVEWQGRVVPSVVVLPD